MKGPSATIQYHQPVNLRTVNLESVLPPNSGYYLTSPQTSILFHRSECIWPQTSLKSKIRASCHRNRDHMRVCVQNAELCTVAEVPCRDHDISSLSKEKPQVEAA